MPLQHDGRITQLLNPRGNAILLFIDVASLPMHRADRQCPRIQAPEITAQDEGHDVGSW